MSPRHGSSQEPREISAVRACGGSTADRPVCNRTCVFADRQRGAGPPSGPHAWQAARARGTIACRSHRLGARNGFCTDTASRDGFRRRSCVAAARGARKPAANAAASSGNLTREYMRVLSVYMHVNHSSFRESGHHAESQWVEMLCGPRRGRTLDAMRRCIAGVHGVARQAILGSRNAQARGRVDDRRPCQRQGGGSGDTAAQQDSLATRRAAPHRGGLIRALHGDARLDRTERDTPEGA
jgi:hypothetical protein